MKQLIENLKTGEVRVAETPAPQCGAAEVLVRNRASLISPGTERLMIEMGKKNLVGKAMARPDLFSLAYRKAKREGFLNVFREAMARLDTPLPLGYSCAGEVIKVGAAVRGVGVGDRVACAGSGFASHAEFVTVPEDLCVVLPRGGSPAEEISYEEASFVMLGGIALHGFRCAEPTPGETVVVIGLGLIGLLLVQIARAYGCRVIGVDIAPDKVQLARKLGCDAALVQDRNNVETVVANLTRGAGADAVIIAAATKDNGPILLAESIARKRARIVLVGVSDLTLTRKAFWDKELTFTVSRASGPSLEGQPREAFLPLELVRWTESRNLEEFLRLVACGSVQLRELITHRYPIGESSGAYDMILRGRERYIGVVITYPSDATGATSVLLKPTSPGQVSTGPGVPRQNVGVIGAGMFARNILLPVVRATDGVRLIGIADRSGLSAGHAGERFGFGYATSDYRALLEDAEVGSVLILTRHDLHARLVVEALNAGKHVYVEKPLALTAEELQEVHRAFQKAQKAQGSRLLMVGFNRQHAPLTSELKKALADRTSPLVVNYRVNAGYIPQDHWTQDAAIGGGRIIGEVCHFVNLLQEITGSDPLEVFAASIGPDSGRFLREDNVVLTLRCADGSLGTITYTAMGSKTFSRERIEVFWEESVAVLDDFRTLEIIQGSRRRKVRLRGQDMGYRREMQAFIGTEVSASQAIFGRAALATLATFGAVEALRTGRPQQVDGSGYLS